MAQGLADGREGAGMKLSDLIRTIGDDKVGIQNLDTCATTLNYNAKSGTKITFGTDQSLTPNGTEKLGMVIWLDRQAVQAVIDKEKAGP